MANKPIPLGELEASQDFTDTCGGMGEEEQKTTMENPRDLAKPSDVLTWQHFPMDESGFYHTPVLLSGSRDAVLLDGVFTYSQGRILTDAILASGKRLTTIYVSCNDPDFYFGLGPVRAAFPDAKLIAAPETVAAIKANLDEKLRIWAEKLGNDGPQSRADVAIPEPYHGNVLMVESERIEIVTTPGMFDRRYLWVPSLKGIFGGTLIISGMHVWMADTPSAETIAAWLAVLDEIIARDPAIVVPGHMIANAPLGVGSVRFTRDYVVAFQDECARAANSSALIAAMEQRYPDFPGTMWLELGAKVFKGEIKWGRGV